MRLFHAENGRRHVTYDYECMQDGSRLVLRRGGAFNIQIDNRVGGDLQCQWSASGQENFVYKRTAVKVVDRNSGRLEISTSYDLAVGLNQFQIITSSGNVVASVSVAILFNIYDRGDDAYCSNKQYRDAYGRQTTGIVVTQVVDGVQPAGNQWYRTLLSITLTFRDFGQYSEVCFNGVLGLVSTRVAVNRRRTVIDLSRALTGQINKIVQGNWDPDNPYEFPTSSYQVFLNLSKGKRTKGQCMTFAQIMITASRALGLVCRPICCIDTHHDSSDRSLTVDRHFEITEGGVEQVSNEETRLITGAASESVWTFHCWCETYMTRSDVGGSTYDGWQVVDGTPQETSLHTGDGTVVSPGDDDKYLCGPFPVKAIREGRINDIRYDGAFIFAEMNAPTFHWYYKRQNDSALHLVKVDPVGHEVGTHLFTQDYRNPKLPMDVTKQYHTPDRPHRHGEISLTSRRAMGYMLKMSEHQPYYTEMIRLAYPAFKERWDKLIEIAGTDEEIDTDKKGRIVYKLNDIETVSMATTHKFVSTLTATNTDSRPHTITVNMVASLKGNNGQTIGVITKYDDKVNLPSGKQLTARLYVYESEYSKLLARSTTIEVKVMASVDGRREWAFNGTDVIRVEKQNLDIEISQPTIRVNDRLEIWATFKVDLLHDLTNVSWVVEGAGILNEERRVALDAWPRTLTRGKQYRMGIAVRPSRASRQRQAITIIMMSAELGDIRADNYVTVVN